MKLRNGFSRTFAPVLAMALALGLATVTDARQDASLRGFEQFQLWIALVQKHELGQVDASVQTVADWDLIKLMDVLASLRTVGQLLEAAGKGQSRIEVNGRVLGVDMIAPLLGLTVAESRLFGDLRKLVNPDDPMRKAINRVLTKGAMLHSQVALTASDELKPAAPRSVRIQASAVRLEDGRESAIADHGIHWAIARQAFDEVGPPRAGTAVARLWYHATSAALQSARNYSSLMPHLEHARDVMPTDARIFLSSGVACENLAGPAVQVAVQEMGATSVQAPRTLWSMAEQYYRRALEFDAGLAEAKLRLGRVLDLQGKHDEARDMLRQAEAAVPTPILRYYAALFLGRAEQARGDFAQARAAYDRAKAQWPMAQSPRLALAELAWRDGDEAGAAAAVQGALAENATPDGGDPFWTYDVSLAGNVPAQLDAVWRLAREGGGK